jgi:Glycosyltransferase 61
MQRDFLPAQSVFKAVTADDLPCLSNLDEFRTASAASIVIEPPGVLSLPSFSVSSSQYSINPQAAPVSADQKLPPSIRYPALKLSVVRDVYCLPFGAPFHMASNSIFVDHLIPWSQFHLGWFSQGEGQSYKIDHGVDLSNVEHEIDTALYLDAPISSHYGHFLTDCTTRLYAFEICQSLFGATKVILSKWNDGMLFQDKLLAAASIPLTDVVRFSGVVRCRRLLMATRALSLERYASPTSNRFFSAMVARTARRDLTLPDRVFLSRAGAGARKMTNEAEVEQLFAGHGFAIVRPELLPVEQQIAIVANARLIAGANGTAMFNLAFQSRLRSAFIMAPNYFVSLSEALFSAGRGCTLRYHIAQGEEPCWEIDLNRLRLEVADWLAEFD